MNFINYKIYCIFLRKIFTKNLNKSGKKAYKNRHLKNFIKVFY